MAGKASARRGEFQVVVFAVAVLSVAIVTTISSVAATVAVVAPSVHFGLAVREAVYYAD